MRVTIGKEGTMQVMIKQGTKTLFVNDLREYPDSCSDNIFVKITEPEAALCLDKGIHLSRSAAQDLLIALEVMLKEESNGTT